LTAQLAGAAVEGVNRRLLERLHHFREFSAIGASALCGPKIKKSGIFINW
jgi:hypothetical protein